MSKSALATSANEAPKNNGRLCGRRIWEEDNGDSNKFVNVKWIQLAYRFKFSLGHVDNRRKRRHLERKSAMLADWLYMFWPHLIQLQFTKTMTHRKQIRRSNLSVSSTILSVILSLSLPLLLPHQAVFAKKKVEAEPAAPVYAKDDPGCRDTVAKAATLFAANKNTDAAELLRSWSSKCMHNAQLHLLLSTILLRLGKTQEEAEKQQRLEELQQPLIACTCPE